MKKIALLLLINILTVPYALAGNGPTIGFTVGTAGQQYSDIYTDVAGISSVSARGTSTGVRVGIPISPFLHLEGSIHDYGEANDDYIDNFGDLISVKLSTTSINFGFAGILPLSYSPTDFIGRIGLAFWDGEVEFRDSAFPGDVLKDDDSGVALYLGAGVRTAITRNVKLGLEYTLLGFDTNYTNVAGEQYIDNFALTIDVGFY